MPFSFSKHLMWDVTAEEHCAGTAVSSAPLAFLSANVGHVLLDFRPEYVVHANLMGSSWGAGQPSSVGSERAFSCPGSRLTTL